MFPPVFSPAFSRPSRSLFLSLTILLFLAPQLLAAQAGSRKVGLQAQLGQGVIMSGSRDRVYLRIDLEGFALEKDEDRTPVNVAIVIDRSGSMQGQRIVQAKRAAKLAVDFLNDDDIISIVTYNNKVNVVVPATKATDRREIKSSIDNFRANGMTALYAGVKRGGHELEKFLDENRVNRVILLSDGMANVGPSSPEALGELGQKLASRGISVTTIGLGLGYNEDLMTKLALSSDGNHAFVEKASDLAKIFSLEFGTVLSVIARDVEIIIQCRPGVKPLRALGRQATVRKDEIRLKFNQLYSKHQKYVVVEFEVDEGRFGRDAEMVDVRVKYRNLATKANDELDRTVRLKYSDSKDEATGSLNKAVMSGIVRQIAIDRNEMALKLKDKGRLKEAQKAFRSNARYLNSFSSSLASPELKKLEQENLNDATVAAKPKREWNKHRKYMKSRQYKGKVQQKY